MRARVGSEYLLLPLHGVTGWLGVSFMTLLNSMGDIYTCNVKNSKNMNKGGSVHMRAYISERIYTLSFSLEFPTSGLAFPQHPSGPLSQQPTKRVVLSAWHVLVEAHAWTWILTTHTELCLRDTPKPGVPRVH